MRHRKKHDQKCETENVWVKTHDRKVQNNVGKCRIKMHYPETKRD